MLTPKHFNTLDAGDPSSTLNPLPPEIAGNETLLTWSLADDAGGSGAKGVDIYVSTDSGPFALWQANVPLTATVFTGEPGHAYAFFTVASDNAGNREAMKASAEATTTLYLPSEAARIEMLAVPAFLRADGSSTSIITATVRDGRQQPLAGYTVHLTATLGTLSTLSATTDASGTVTVTLTAGSTPGTAVVTARADTVLGPVVATATVTMIAGLFGDVDGDCDVDIIDIMLVARRWNSTAGQPKYDAHYDLDHDGDIDIVDIMQVAVRWGQSCS